MISPIDTNSSAMVQQPFDPQTNTSSSPNSSGLSVQRHQSSLTSATASAGPCSSANSESNADTRPDTSSSLKERVRKLVLRKDQSQDSNSSHPASEDGYKSHIHMDESPFSNSGRKGKGKEDESAGGKRQGNASGAEDEVMSQRPRNVKNVPRPQLERA